MVMAPDRDQTERAQRIRAGVTGLAAVLIIAALVGAILRTATDVPNSTGMVAATPGNTATAVETSPNEPLADLGVAPPANASAGVGAPK